MKTSIAFCAFMIVGVNLYGESMANHLVGTWSNKKQEFNICTVGFRADGTGNMMYAGVGGAPLKWKESGTNTLVRMPGAPESQDLVFSFGPFPDTIQTTWIDGQEQIFYLIDKTEPPDVVAMAREARKMDWDESREQFNVATSVVSSATDIPAHFGNFMDTSRQIAYVIVANSSSNVIFTMERFNTNTSVDVTSMYAGDSYIDQFATTGEWAESPPTNGWTQNILIPDETISRLQAWLTSRGMSIKTIYGIQRDVWELKRYERILRIQILPSDITELETIKYILTIALSHAAPPFSVVVTTSK